MMQNPDRCREAAQKGCLEISNPKPLTEFAGGPQLAYGAVMGCLAGCIPAGIDHLEVVGVISNQWRFEVRQAHCDGTCLALTPTKLAITRVKLTEIGNV